MSRTACVWIPRFELNARRAAEPGLRGEALIIADVGSVRAAVLDASAEARACGVKPRMSMVTARALCPEATLIPPDPAFVRERCDELLAALYELSPVVGHDREGTFFLQLEGLARIHPDERALAARVRALTHARRLPAAIALADRPITAWIAAHSCEVADDTVTGERGEPVIVAPVIVKSGADREFLARLPAERIPMPAQLSALCRLLGLETVAELQRLPTGALVRRFGRAGAEVQQRIAAKTEEIYRVEIPEVAPCERLDLDEPTDDFEVLLFLHKSVLDRLLKQVVLTRRVVAGLGLTLTLCDSERSEVCRTFRPARPTVEARVLLDLVILWLRELSLAAPVEAIALSAMELCVATTRQLSLFQRREASERDEALALAIARLVAAFGKGAVVRPRLAERHLPEARLRWEPVTRPEGAERADAAASGRVDAPTTGTALPVLRLLSPPRPARLSRSGAQRSLRVAGDRRARRVLAAHGPYRLEGEWWRDERFARAYLLVYTDEGEVCWLFRDELVAKEGKGRDEPAPPASWYLHAYLN